VTNPLYIETEPGRFRLNWPNGLTMLRLLLLPFFLWTLLGGARHDFDGIWPSPTLHWVSIAVFAMMAVTDKLDGYLARRLNQASKLGAIIDPIADKLLIACSLILLSFTWVIPADFAVPILVVLGVYAKDCFSALGAIWLLRKIGRVEISAKMSGKAATAMQLSLILATLIAPDLAQLNRSAAIILTRGLWGLVLLTTAAAGADYIYEACGQYSRFKHRGLPAAA
jgi:CDP-diacylglycerol--glycerol-3-phosphate 3-phosphatidyltransferase